MTEKKDFVEFMLGPEADHYYVHFYEFADSINIEKGENIKHFCRLCIDPNTHAYMYETGVAKSYYDVDRIDTQIVNHLWNKHCEVVSKRVHEYFIQKIALAPGQKRLEL